LTDKQEFICKNISYKQVLTKNQQTQKFIKYPIIIIAFKLKYYLMLIMH